MELTTATPVEVDTALAEIWGRGARANFEVDRLSRWLKDARDALVKEESGDIRYSAMRSAERVADLEDKLAAAQLAATKVWAEAVPFNAEYERRGRWARAYLVDNSGGHVHRKMDCETTYATTAFVWLPEYSGADAEKVVTDAGALTCLVCYGSVRDAILTARGIDPTAQKSRIEAPARRAARLEREAAKKARDEKARIAGITDAEAGGPLRIKEHGYTETLKTLRTARTWLTDSYGPYAYSRDAANLARVIAAVAKKEDKDAATVVAEAKRRAAKRG